MGARVYLPVLGRFLSADPVEGGTDNAYVYPTDPINGFDLTGTFQFRKYFKIAVQVVGVASAAACIILSVGMCAIGIAAAAAVSIGSDAWALKNHKEGMTGAKFAANTLFTVGTSFIPGVRASSAGFHNARTAAAGLVRNSKFLRNLPVLGARSTLSLRGAIARQPWRSAYRTVAYGYGGFHSWTGRWW